VEIQGKALNWIILRKIRQVKPAVMIIARQQKNDLFIEGSSLQIAGSEIQGHQSYPAPKNIPENVIYISDFFRM
jgi:hypothetical protein